MCGQCGGFCGEAGRRREQALFKFGAGIPSRVFYYPVTGELKGDRRPAFELCRTGLRNGSFFGGFLLCLLFTLVLGF
jgi:hypothetical protein